MTKTRVAVVGALVLSVTVAVSVVLVRWTGSDWPLGRPSPSASLLPTAQGEWRLGYRAEYGELNEVPERGMAATAPDDVWYVEQGSAVHYDGARWREMRPRYGGHVLQLNGQVAASDREVWLVAYWLSPDGETNEHGELLRPCVDYKEWALHWDGSRWIGRRLPCDADDLIVSDDGAMWVTRTEPGEGLLWYRWDRAGWSRQPTLATRPPRYVHAADAPAEDDLWVSGETTSGVFVAHWDGAAWHKVPPPPVKRSVRRIVSEAGESFISYDPYVSDVLAVAGDEVWVVVGAYWSGKVDNGLVGLLYRYDGARWHEVTVPSPDRHRLRVTGVGRGPDGKIWCTVNRPWMVRRVGHDWQPTPPVPDAKKRKTRSGLEMAGTTIGGFVTAGETTWVVTDTLRGYDEGRTVAIYRAA